MKIVITGAHGQPGNGLVERMRSCELIAVTYADDEICHVEGDVLWKEWFPGIQR